MKKKLLILARGGFSYCSSRKFRPSRSPFSAPPKSVSIEASNSVGPLNIKWHGLSYAASVVSETPNTQKGRKKLSKNERRAMIESFVNKYRAMNDEKFPTITDTVKQVGGSYYVVREIIQEIKHKSKINYSNNTDKNLVDKELFNESKLPTSEPVISSGYTETAKGRPIEDDSQSLVLDGKETVDTGYEHLEEKRGPQTSSRERFSEEVIINSIPVNHFMASESNLLERYSQEPYQSSIQEPNNVKSEEAVSSYSDSVSPKNHLRKGEIERDSNTFSENYVTSYGKAQGHESENVTVDMENCLMMGEKCVDTAGYEKMEHAALDNLYKEPSCSSFQMLNDVKTEKAVSGYSSDSIPPGRHLLKDAVEHVSPPFVDKSGSSCSEDQSYDSEFVHMENPPIIKEKTFEKAGFERRELENLPGMDDQKHEMEQCQGSLGLDETKTENSNNRQTSDVIVSEKSTLWRNLKSFVEGIFNFWKKF